MLTRDFLVEIGTEELPPKALRNLSQSFADGVSAGLKHNQLGFKGLRKFATPRRLALLISGLDEQQQDRITERVGPAVSAAFTKEGNVTPAALGFARSCNVDVSDLSRVQKDGVEKLAHSTSEIGQKTQKLLPAIIDNALAGLPIPKSMRWGSSRDEFVRPVHWVVLLFGPELIPTKLLGIDSAAHTFGHRFHFNHKIPIEHPADYESLLENPGFVIPDFDKRKSLIRSLVEAEANAIDANAVIDDDLLDEVTSLVEFPVALMGNFDEHFLEVPPEVLILAMKSHQKCFYLTDDQGKLLPRFIAVSNIRSTDPKQVIEGNERVIRPRLADARFFYETDKQTPLFSRRDQLQKVVFQQNLGSVYDKSERVAQLARFIAAAIGGNAEYCQRAAELSKCDLVTSMVGEFADLQGLMGYYYALHDGEPTEVATAINEQYKPRYAGDMLPATTTGCVLALADKLDSIVGMFAVGQPPTGSKDPFALRRSAIGVLRILVEGKRDLNLFQAIEKSVSLLHFTSPPPETRDRVFDFLLERFRAWYLEAGVGADVFQSVFSVRPERPLDFHQRIDAVRHFSKLDASHSLAAANKRVTNILAKHDVTVLPAEVDPGLLKEPAEKALFDKLTQVTALATPLFDSGAYREGLEHMALLKDDVDLFFDNVLVMSEDARLQANRLAMLSKLRSLFLRVADISFLHND